jgi:hypothetical protein
MYCTRTDLGKVVIVAVKPTKISVRPKIAVNFEPIEIAHIAGSRYRMCDNIATIKARIIPTAYKQYVATSPTIE